MRPIDQTGRLIVLIPGNKQQVKSRLPDTSKLNAILEMASVFRRYQSPSLICFHWMGGIRHPTSDSSATHVKLIYWPSEMLSHLHI